MEIAKEKAILPPYVSYKSFYNFLESLQQGIPARIDKSLMKNLSGAAQGQIIAALRYLSLIDDQGIVTDSLARLVKSQRPERQQLLQTIIKSSYPFLFDEFDLTTATSALFEQKFREIGATGDTVRRCATFFLYAAKEAEIPLSPYITKLSKQHSRTGGSSNGSLNGTSKPRKKRTTAEKIDNANPEPQATHIVTESRQSSWGKMLLEKFPPLDPDWPEEVKEKWFHSFDRLMSLGMEKEIEP